MLHMTKTLSPPSVKSKPPRVSVPVAADVLAIFERLAKAGNMSTGRAMAEWLADTVDAAELMASTMERARAAPKIVTAELHAMVLGMADMTKEMADKYSRFKGPLVEAAADNGGRPRAGGAVSGADEASEGAIPPSCNTGGKVPTGGKGERGIKLLSTLGKTSITKTKKPSSGLPGLTSPKSPK
jgi:hypothetical protein